MKGLYENYALRKLRFQNCLNEDNYPKASSTAATVVKLYNDLLQKGNLDDKFPADLVIRPLQDATKVGTFVKKSKESGTIPLLKSIAFHDSYEKPKSQNNHAEIKLKKLLKNPPKEIAIQNEVSMTEIKQQYIGISKLCCYHCHRKLGINFLHRGTHGLLFSDYISKYKKELFGKIPLSGDNARLRCQKRKLSTDEEFETESLKAFKTTVY